MRNVVQLCLVVGIVIAEAGHAATSDHHQPAPQPSGAVVVAQVNEEVITLGEVSWGMPIVCGGLSCASSPAELARRLQQVEDEIVRARIDDMLVVQHFRRTARSPMAEQAFDRELDREIARRLRTEFGDNAATFVDYLDRIQQTATGYRALVEREYIIQRVREERNRVSPVIAAAEVERAYAARRESFRRPEAVHLRLIRLVAAPDEDISSLEEAADAVMALLVAGADFAAISRAVSDGSRSAQGGDWGWIPRQDLRKELADVAFALEPGECSEPVRLDRDIFIVKVEAKRRAGIPPLAEVRAQIEEQLRTQARQEAWQQWLEGLRRAARIQIVDPSAN